MEDFKLLLYRFKYDIEYYKLYYDRFTLINRSIEFGIACLTVSSFVLLSISDSFRIISIIILGGVQVASLMKVYLPYSNRALELSRLLLRYENLFIEMENELLNISDEECNIQEKIKKYKEVRIKIQYEYLPNDNLKPNKKFTEMAEKSAESYFNNWVK